MRRSSRRHNILARNGWSIPKHFPGFLDRKGENKPNL
jgi:hypothetical protein